MQHRYIEVKRQGYPLRFYSIIVLHIYFNGIASTVYFGDIMADLGGRLK